MSNKDLLKQAIAEAKTIREAAIANAKEALEESLTPHLREMLAAKLQEMELSEEDVLDETPQYEGDSNKPIYEAEEDEDEVEDEEEEVEGDEAGEEEVEDGDVNLDPESPTFTDDVRALVRDIVAQEVGHEEGPKQLDGEEAEINLDAEPQQQDGMVGMEDENLEEDIDISELLAELEEDNKVDTKMEAIEEPNPMKEELDQALATVAELRSQLQEVNLLNAKLLYVNKVFKANNLTEGQKVNVVAAFDKAETVREVKLVFETVSKNVSNKPVTTVKEHKSFASKPAGSTQKQVINEVSETVKRMQKLAGII